MGATAAGLPWPNPDALVHQGDDAIRALAEALDPGVTPYVPTWTGVTLGGASVDAVYTKVGRFCDVFVLLGFTGGTVITADVTFTLPVPARSPQRLTISAMGRPNPSAGVYDMSAVSFTGTTVSIRYPGTSGLLTALTATTPLAWVTGGWLVAMGRYIVATGAATTTPAEADTP